MELSQGQKFSDGPTGGFILPIYQTDVREFSDVQSCKLLSGADDVLVMVQFVECADWTV